MATAGYPRIGKDRAITVRLASGLTSRAVSFVASEIVLPGGEDAILLAAPSAGRQLAQPDRGRDARSAGSTRPGNMRRSSMPKPESPPLRAASTGSGSAPRRWRELVAEASGERLVKRMIHAAAPRLPAGFVRLTDEPAIYLLVVVDEPEPEETAAPSEATASGGRGSGSASRQRQAGPVR